MCGTRTLVPIPDLLADVREYAHPTHPEYGQLDDGTLCLALDTCIIPALEALWAAGVRTVGSCCGHDEVNGVISLETT